MWLILFPILLFSSFTFAQTEGEEEAISLVIENPKIPATFSETEKNQSGKIILKACTKVRGYQIIIGEFDPVIKAKFQVHVVEVEVMMNANSNYTMSARLFDEKTKKLINKVTFENVEKLSYFRELERMMNELFLPVNLEVEKESKKVKNPKKTSKARGPTPPTEADTSNLNFKERIMSLKSGVDATLKNLADATKIEKAEDKPTDGSGKAQEQKPAMVAQSNRVESDFMMDKIPPKNPSFPNTKPVHKIGLMVKNYATNSKDGIIDLDTKLVYFGMAYRYQKPIAYGSDEFIQATAEIGRVQSKSDQNFPPYLHLASAYGHLFRKYGTFLRGGVDADTLNFTNLPVIGGGLQSCNVKLVTGLVGVQWSGVFFNKPIVIGGDYLRPVYGLSSNSQVKKSKVEGHGLKGTFMISELYFNLHLKLDYFVTNYDFISSDTKLTTSTQGFAINVNYVF